MKAWQFTGTNNPLTLNEVAEPSAGPGQVVVSVKAAGVCHSDVTAIDDAGWMPLFPELPRTMGHENAGVITEVGAGMEHWKVGDRVGLSPVMKDGDALGYGKWDGGFGPQLLATDDNLVKLPDEVSFELGAMATDAGLTAYHAIMAVGGAKPGMKVGVIGLGGLGYIGARVAALSGAEVYGAEVTPRRKSSPVRSASPEWPSPLRRSRTRTWTSSWTTPGSAPPPPLRSRPSPSSARWSRWAWDASKRPSTPTR